KSSQLLVGAGTPDPTPAGVGARWDDWGCVELLVRMCAKGADATPYLRLGGRESTDMAGICHEVTRAGQRAAVAAAAAAEAAADSSSAPSSSTTGPGPGGAPGGGTAQGAVWRAQRCSLVETALEEGVRFVHVPGLEGPGPGGVVATGAIGGVGGGGGTWPGASGYSFSCWMRFDPSMSAAATAA
ncbi:unnamed protein product, partial [Discosporangium mesarthrocarpum]